VRTSEGANLISADLSEADLSGADIFEATLFSVVLDGVNFERTPLGISTFHPVADWIRSVTFPRLE
jgi:uncharacterized protein YjbI with pentapeptide repeats